MNNKKILTKTLAGMLAFILLFANVLTFALGVKETYALSQDLENQDTEINDAVSFDAYFKKKGEVLHSKEINVASIDKLYVEINVLDGYLKDGVIELKDSNFRLIKSEKKNDIVQDISVEEGKVYLNRIDKGEEITLEFDIELNKESNFSVKSLDDTSKVVLNGTFVNVKESIINTRAKETEISKEIEVHAKFSAEAIAMLEEDVIKYVKFDKNGKKGVILQTSIKSNLVDNILPVKQTELQIEIPKINNIEPKSIILSSASTRATNGEGARQFGLDDYNIEDGKIILTINNNEKEDGTVSWLKNETDEIIVTYLYDENAIVKKETIQLNATNKITVYDSEMSIVEVGLEQEVVMEKEIGDIVTVDVNTNVDKISKGYMIVEGADNTPYEEKISINIGNTELINGIKLKNNVNYLNEKKNKFEESPLYTYIKIEKENFKGTFGEFGDIQIINKEGRIITTLDFENSEYVFDEETPYIEMHTSKPVGEGILEINVGREIKSATYSKEETLEFNEMDTEVAIEVIYEEGEVTNQNASKSVILENPKTIVNTNINKENLVVAEINEQVEVRVVLDTSDNEKSLYKNPKISIEFPSYVENISDGKIGLLYDKELKIVNSETNKNENGNLVVNVEIEGEQTEFNDLPVSNGATLVMFANIEINELTPGVEDSIKVTVTNENEIKDEEITKNIPISYAAKKGIITSNGITVYGEENLEAKAIQKEEIITIDGKEEAQDIKINLEMVNSVGDDIANVKILGRIPFTGNKKITSDELLGTTVSTYMINGISEGTLGEKEVDIYYSENEEADIDLENEENEWTQELSDFSNVKSYLIVFRNELISNGDKASFDYDVQIPGNIFGTKEIYSTFAVYYNEIDRTEVNEEEEENAEENEIIEEVIDEVVIETENIENTIYKIMEDIRKEEAKAVGLIINGAAIMQANTNNNQDGTEENPIQNLGAENEELPDYMKPYEFKEEDFEIKATIKSSGEEITEETEVKEGQFVDYEVTIKNLNFRTANVTLNILKENGVFYGIHAYDRNTFNEILYKYDELEDESIIEDIELEPGEVKNITFTLVVNKDTKGSDLKAIVLIKQGEKEVTNKTLQNEIVEGKIKLHIEYNSSENALVFSNHTFSFVINVTNITSNTLSDIEINTEIPEILTIVEGTFYDEDSDFETRNINGNKVTYKIKEINPGDTATIYVLTKTGKIALWEEKQDIEIFLKSTIDGKDYASNILKKTVNQAETFIKAEMIGDVLDNEVSNGDEIIYTINVENSGVIEEYSLGIDDELPEGVEVKDITFIDSLGNETTEELTYNHINKIYRVDAGSNVQIKIRAVVNTPKVAMPVIKNYATISGKNIEEFKTNEVEYTVKDFSEVPSQDYPYLDNPNENDNFENPEDNNEEIPENPLNPIVPGENYTYSISGRVWSDINSNGKRDDGENGIAGIAVMLMNSEKSGFVKDESGKEITIITNGDGEYEFTGLPSGEYIVVFMCDMELYGITTYQKTGVSSSQNSDAIEETIKMNGIDTSVAVTDTITIGSSDKKDIDLGLTTLKKFDLRLEKVVNTVIVQNKQGTKTYTFKNNKMAKVEIPAKYMVGSNLTIEYKISITNEGDIAGNIGKIVDYIPKSLTFSADINNEWYKGTDGYIYSREFESTVINPGETKEITLVLTKKVQEEASEIINNSAEISENINSLGLQDIDSTPGNGISSEDDFSSADLIITIKTGVMTYTLISLVIGAMLSAIVTIMYLINKKNIKIEIIQEERR